jgi:hypothetical protein
MLYVGIIAAIEEHAYDHCRRNVSGHVYIYIRTHCVTHLRVLRLLNMSLVLEQRERETMKVVQGSLGTVLLYHGWFRKDSKSY